LVTTGLYGWVRHPLYTAFLVEAVGISLLMANWFVAVTAGSLWTLLAMRTRQEERKLIERFGDEYQEYMRRVGRFLPRLRRPP
jgi:protein-S-isoprenylcysteine O-methyltransferase Ste14